MARAAAWLGVGAAAALACQPPEPAPAATPPSPRGGLWLDPARLAALPTEGPAWDNLLEAAHAPVAPPDLQDGNQLSNVRVLAKALVHARTGDPELRQQVVGLCAAAIGTEDGHRPGRSAAFRRVRSLGPARELAAYVVAADLVGLPPELDARFRAWLRELLGKSLGGRSIRSTHEDRPNNWGTHAGAARIAVAAYLGDRAELDDAARVLRGFLGDRSAYADFRFGALSWQADPDAPVPINPAGARRDGHSIDGVLPDDQRRAEVDGGRFRWPPPKENYVYEALQGVLAQAILLERAGHADVWQWGDRAILRAYRWLHVECDFPAEGDDRWQLPVVDARYGTDFWDGEPTRPGKNFGWTCWTHGG